MAPLPPTDAELLRLYARSRDDEAFGRIVARHMRAVRLVAYRHVGHKQAAEDVAQAAFLVLAQRPRSAMRSARRKRSALPWLAKVAKYAAANWRRAETRRDRRERLVARSDVTFDPTTPTVGHELAEAVQSALSCLPRRDKRIVELRHLSQMPWDEVARLAGTTPEAARKAGTRALSQLRVVLEKRGITAGTAAVLAGLRALTIPTQSAAATVATITTPEQIAQGVLTMFKVQTAAVATSALLVFTGLVSTAAIQITADSPAADVANAAQPQRVAVKISGDVDVELVAVGDGEGLWWAPGGEELAELQVDLPQLPGDRQAGERVSAAVVRLTGLRAGERVYALPNGIGYGYAMPHDPQGKPLDVAISWAHDSDDPPTIDILRPMEEADALILESHHLDVQAVGAFSGLNIRLLPLMRPAPGASGPRSPRDDEEIVATVVVDGPLYGTLLKATLTGADDKQRSFIAQGRAKEPDLNVLTFNLGRVRDWNLASLRLSAIPTEVVRFTALPVDFANPTQPKVEVLDTEQLAKIGELPASRTGN